MVKKYPSFNFRLTDEELKKLNEASEMSNLRPSALARKAILDAAEKIIDERKQQHEQYLQGPTKSQY